MFQALEQRVVTDDRVAAEAEARRAEFARREAVRAEQQRLRRIDDARAGRARAEVRAWREAQEFEAYTAVLRQGLPGLEGVEALRIEHWCEWLEDRARRSDPTRSTALILGLDDKRDGRGG